MRARCRLNSTSFIGTDRQGGPQTQQVIQESEGMHAHSHTLFIVLRCGCRQRVWWILYMESYIWERGFFAAQVSFGANAGQHPAQPPTSQLQVALRAHLPPGLLPQSTFCFLDKTGACFGPLRQQGGVLAAATLDRHALVVPAVMNASRGADASIYTARSCSTRRVRRTCLTCRAGVMDTLMRPLTSAGEVSRLQYDGMMRQRQPTTHPPVPRPSSPSAQAA